MFKISHHRHKPQHNMLCWLSTEIKKSVFHYLKIVILGGFYLFFFFLKLFLVLFRCLCLFGFVWVVLVLCEFCGFVCFISLVLFFVLFHFVLPHKFKVI